ncbi:MmcQ/YjbR family DNA-binding protein [Brevundimonas subvibrioides]|uniref:MmcQ/YjbR family DNA-binding protein n=1 Tax=Brevundimonas subvibrioides TaxID=74313 RepID=UPI0022B319FE|nr:MmcQ/YjbR family DNA-binding protein [Brevundimonas subvibrioides]
MASPDDLARIALSLPGVVGEGVDFAIGRKAICWTYLARATPRGRREPVDGVVAIRCDLTAKEMLIATVPDRFFDDDHYRGYPAVLARLDALDPSELAGLLQTAWSLQAPARLKKTPREP